MESIVNNNKTKYEDTFAYYRMKENADRKYKIKKIKSKNSNLQLNYFLYTILLFIFSMLIIYNYACITQGKMETERIEIEITDLQKEKEDIIIGLETLKNSNLIEQNAMNYLGMNYASKNQSNYILVEYETGTADNYDKEDSKDSYLSMILDKAFYMLVNEGI